MTDYTELVKDLRDTERVCRDRMDGQVMLDAAAAIDALQAELSSVIADAGARIGKAEAEVKRLEPKRGEWSEENRRPRSSQFVCSVCHRTGYDQQPTRDKAWRKRCRYAYCPNCGAKIEVQDADT